MINDDRGFTLLIALLLATVAVTLGVSLLDISYKQVVLSSTAKQSQYGFYAADSAMECALFWDQKFNAFSYYSPKVYTDLSCENRPILSYSTETDTEGGAHRKTTFEVSCGIAEKTNGIVTVYKYQTGTTTIYANGFSSCDTDDQRRVERGLKVFY